MSKKLRNVGALIFEAPVAVTPDGFDVKATAVGHLRHHLTILDHALGAYGPFRVDRNLLPSAGTFTVEVIDTSAAGNAIFDNDAFQSLLIQLNKACNEVAAMDKDYTDISAVAEDFSIKTGGAKDRIQRFLEAVQQHDGVTVIDNEGHGVLLGSHYRPAHQHKETIDVDVADRKNLIRIDTTENTYLLVTTAEADLKHGDKIRVNDSGQLGEMECIAADAATPIPPPQPSIFD